jgi:RNA polymerase sigma factor (sigma-70 family)
MKPKSNTGAGCPGRALPAESALVQYALLSVAGSDPLPAAPGAFCAMNDGAEDTALLRESRESLIDELDRRFRRPLVNYFKKRIRESYDVDDLVQEVFIRLRCRDALDEIDFLEAYVFETAANVVRDRFRKRIVRRASDHTSLEKCELPVNDFSPERVLQGRQLLDRAFQALLDLSERTREVFVLRLYEGLKQEQIAVSLSMSVDGVRFHLRRAKEHMARALEQDA